MSKIGSRIGTAALVISLLGLLAVSIGFAARSFTFEGPPLPTEGFIAMILGSVFSVVIGCGLMALIFYSNRYGYDERSNRDQRRLDDEGHEMHRSHEAELR